MIRYLHASCRGAHFGVQLVRCALDYALHVRGADLPTRTRWNQRCCQRLLRALSLSVDAQVAPVQPGLLVGNHLSYLDILVLGALHPLVFVSKSEVRSWPVFGWLATKAGTVFLQRERRSDLVRVQQEIQVAVAAGLTVVFFPEGTTTDGRTIRPFHAGLFVGAADNRWPVTPVWLGYALAEGSVADEVCYWRDMSFPTHFLNLLTKRGIVARVRQGPALPGIPDRRQLSLAAHAAVASLALAVEPPHSDPPTHPVVAPDPAGMHGHAILTARAPIGRTAPARGPERPT